MAVRRNWRGWSGGRLSPVQKMAWRYLTQRNNWSNQFSALVEIVCDLSPPCQRPSSASRCSDVSHDHVTCSSFDVCSSSSSCLSFANRLFYGALFAQLFPGRTIRAKSPTRRRDAAALWCQSRWSETKRSSVGLRSLLPRSAFCVPGPKRSPSPPPPTANPPTFGRHWSNVPAAWGEAIARAGTRSSTAPLSPRTAACGCCGPASGARPGSFSGAWPPPVRPQSAGQASVFRSAWIRHTTPGAWSCGTGRSSSQPRSRWRRRVQSLVSISGKEEHERASIEQKMTKKFV